MVKVWVDGAERHSIWGKGKRQALEVGPGEAECSLPERTHWSGIHRTEIGAAVTTADLRTSR